MAIILKWQISEVIILPFGGLTKFNEKVNKPIIEEFLIAIMGIIFQIIFCFPINKTYNLIIILFNLIPIYPLDGYKILNLFFNKVFNFKLSYYLSIYLSWIILIIILIIFFIKKDLLVILINIPFLLQLIQEYYKRSNYFNKFYLERYLYKFNFKKIKIIKNINQMKRDYIHTFNIQKKYLKERDFLQKWFDKRE